MNEPGSTKLATVLEGLNLLSYSHQAENVQLHPPCTDFYFRQKQKHQVSCLINQ